MSKRYVIQVQEYVGINMPDVDGNGCRWQTVQHPAGGDWMTRSRSTAIADAAKLVHNGETRELRIGVSKPVYEVTPVIDMEQILAAKAEINWADADVDSIDDVVLNQDELDENDAPIELVDITTFELVDESSNDGPAYTHGDDPTGN